MGSINVNLKAALRGKALITSSMRALVWLLTGISVPPQVSVLVTLGVLGKVAALYSTDKKDTKWLRRRWSNFYITFSKNLYLSERTPTYITHEGLFA
jgi:hypothetical protein